MKDLISLWKKQGTQGIKLYYKVGETVFVNDWMQWPSIPSFVPTVSLETQVGIVVEKYNTLQLSKQITTIPGGVTYRTMSKIYSQTEHIHSLTFSSKAFKSWDIQYKDYISQNKTPKSGRWHKYYVVMIGDKKKIYMYKDLKKCPTNDI